MPCNCPAPVLPGSVRFLLSHLWGRRQDDIKALACKKWLFSCISTLFAPSELVRCLCYNGGCSVSPHWHDVAAFLHTCFHPACAAWGKTWHCLSALPNLVLVMSLGDGGSSSPPTRSLDIVFYRARRGLKENNNSSFSDFFNNHWEKK